MKEDFTQIWSEMQESTYQVPLDLASGMERGGIQGLSGSKACAGSIEDGTGIRRTTRIRRREDQENVKAHNRSETRRVLERHNQGTRETHVFPSLSGLPVPTSSKL
jgi:hypothetical protein